MEGRIDSQALLIWNATPRRDLPWRSPDTSEWGLLVAEILLKREQGERVGVIWQELAELCPTPSHLLRADASELAHLLKPLGLQNQRVRALKHIAAILVGKHKGKVPAYGKLSEVKWVGPYTAGALEVFHRGGRVPLVDPNICRVGSRVFGVSEARKNRADLSQRVLNSAPRGDEASFYYAVLDLGALVCRARPRCPECPIAPTCSYAARDLSRY